jgi:hypothetical protein
MCLLNRILTHMDSFIVGVVICKLTPLFRRRLTRLEDSAVDLLGCAPITCHLVWSFVQITNQLQYLGWFLKCGLNWGLMSHLSTVIRLLLHLTC